MQINMNLNCWDQRIQANEIQLSQMLLNLIPTTLCMVITISVMLSLKESLGPAEIFEGLMKLSALPIIGIRGYVCGYSYAKDVRARWLETKSRLLEGFLTATGLTNPE